MACDKVIQARADVASLTMEECSTNASEDPKFQKRSPNYNREHRKSPSQKASMATNEIQVIDLKPPTSVARVSPESADQSIKLAASDTTKIDSQVDGDVEKFMSLDVHSPEFTSYVNQITSLGRDEIAASASASSRLLDEPMRMVKGGASPSEDVGKNILALRREMEKLDPQKAGLLRGAKKILGFIPFGNTVTDYFNAYASAKSTLDGIVDSLRRGRDQILRDNAAIEVEQQRIWESMTRLRKFSYYASKLDDSLEREIDSIKSSDPERAKILRDDVLYRLTQRRQSIMTQMAVNTQGYMVIGMIMKTNDDLAITVDDTTTTSMSAMRTAVLAAQTLSGQKDLIEKVRGMRQATNNMIVSTSKMLEQNSTDIAQVSSDPAVSVAALTESFSHVFKAMDAYSDYHEKAIDAMKVSIAGMETQIERSRNYLEPERQAIIAAKNKPVTLGQIKIDWWATSRNYQISR